MDIIDFRVQGDMDGHLAICSDLRTADCERRIELTLYDDVQTNALGGFKAGKVVWKKSDIVDGLITEYRASTVVTGAKLWSAGK